MLSIRFLALLTALLLTLSLANASHVLFGKAVQDTDCSSSDLTRMCHAVATITKPLVCWEDIVADGAHLKRCTEKVLVFSGNIDEEDFKEDTVITFPRAEYVKLGCPIPPPTDEVSKKDPFIFRTINRAIFSEGKVKLYTSPISGADVVPQVDFEIKMIEESDRKLTNASLPGSSRINSVIDQEFEATNEISTAITVDWSVSIDSRGYSFSFRRGGGGIGGHVEWRQNFEADVEGTVTIEGSDTLSFSTEMARFPISRAAYSGRLYLFGDVEIGPFLVFDFVADLSYNAEVIVTFSGGIRSETCIDIGLRVNVNSDDPQDVDSHSVRDVDGDATISFERSEATSSSITGFLGVRPSLELAFSFETLGNATVNLGASIGIEADYTKKSPAFPALSSGSSTCRKCHSAEGTLSLKGKDLTVTTELPIVNVPDFTILETFLDVTFARLCQFEAQCPPPPSCDCSCRFFLSVNCDDGCPQKSCGFLRRKCCD